MKRFIKVFLLLELLLLFYLFNSSIYNIYEKNHIFEKNLNGFSLETNDADTMGKFYDEFIENYQTEKIEIINNTLSTTDKSIYEIFCYPLEKFVKKQPVSQSIRLEYKKLEREDFTDSLGEFYTSLSEKKISDICKKIDCGYKIYKPETIAYQMVLKYNLYNILLLLIIVQSIFFIYTSYHFKRIGIKKSMGFSNLKILKELVVEIVRILAIVFAFGIILQCVYLFINQRFSVHYLACAIIFFFAVLLVNVICILNTTVLVHFVQLDAMIKNRTFNQGTNAVMQALKIIFSVAIVITIISLTGQEKEYRKNQQDILNYRELEGYYCANGFRSEEYEAILSDSNALDKYSEKMKKLYNESNALLCDNRAITDSQRKGRMQENGAPQYEQSYIVANEAYLNRFSDLKDEKGNKIDYSSLENKTVLIPEQYKKDESTLKDLLNSVYESLVIYNKFYGLKPDNIEQEPISIQYVKQGQSIQVNTESGFKNLYNLIFIIDKGNFGGLYYLDMINTRNLFFDFKDRDEFAVKLADYNLDSLIIPGTLLTPYLMKMENTAFVLKMLLMFSVLFIISLIFILYMSNYVDVFVNRQKYALKEILGYSHFKILKSRYLIFILWCMIGAGLCIYKSDYFSFILIAVLDLAFEEFMYRVNIKNSLCEIEKGA